jgi:HEAT repeat protein
VRREALLATLVYRDLADELRSSVFGAVNDSDKSVRLLALRIVRGMGQKAAPAAPQLVSVIERGDSRAKIFALEALGSLRQASPEILNSLEKALHDPVTRTRTAALDSLKQIGFSHPDKVIPILEKALSEEKNQGIKRSMANSLRRLEQAKQ